MTLQTHVLCNKTIWSDKSQGIDTAKLKTPTIYVTFKLSKPERNHEKKISGASCEFIVK